MPQSVSNGKVDPAFGKIFSDKIFPAFAKMWENWYIFNISDDKVVTVILMTVKIIMWPIFFSFNFVICGFRFRGIRSLDFNQNKYLFRYKMKSPFAFYWPWINFVIITEYELLTWGPLSGGCSPPFWGWRGGKRVFSGNAGVFLLNWKWNIIYRKIKIALKIFLVFFLNLTSAYNLVPTRIFSRLYPVCRL